MKIHYEPKVHLAAKTAMCDISPFLASEGVAWRPDGDIASVSEVAGRLCYMSYDSRRPGDYFANILASGHGSVIEHINVSLIFSGVSRTFSHELVRHRAGFAYSQLSQRYVDESVCEVVCPWELREEVRLAEQFCEHHACDAGSLIQSMKVNEIPMPAQSAMVGLTWMQSNELAFETYRHHVEYLLEKVTAVARADAGRIGMDEWFASLLSKYKTEFRKIARQAARSVLPNCCETKVFVTANARAWRHFLEMRASKPAEPEIRRAATAAYRILLAECPPMFSDYVENPLPDGTVELTTQWRKV